MVGERLVVVENVEVPFDTPDLADLYFILDLVGESSFFRTSRRCCCCCGSALFSLFPINEVDGDVGIGRMSYPIPVGGTAAFWTLDFVMVYRLDGTVVVGFISSSFLLLVSYNVERRLVLSLSSCCRYDTVSHPVGSDGMIVVAVTSNTGIESSSSSSFRIKVVMYRFRRRRVDENDVVVIGSDGGMVTSVVASDGVSICWTRLVMVAAVHTDKAIDGSNPSLFRWVWVYGNLGTTNGRDDDNDDDDDNDSGGIVPVANNDTNRNNPLKSVTIMALLSLLLLLLLLLFVGLE